MSETARRWREERRGHAEWKAARAAGRLAGLREAAEVVSGQRCVGRETFKDNDWFKGHEAAVDRCHAAILALAEGEEG